MTEDSEAFAQLRKNMVELIKLFEDGLSLRLAYMISKHNVYSDYQVKESSSGRYLEVIRRCRKALNCSMAC